MVNPNRKFFVGGNFKMNGTVDMITKLIEHLNNAPLDGKTGEQALSVFCPSLLMHDHLQRSSLPLPQSTSSR